MALSAFEIFGLVQLKPDLGLTSNIGGTPSRQSSIPVIGVQEVCVGMEQRSKILPWDQDASKFSKGRCCH